MSSLNSGWNMPPGCFSTPYDNITCPSCERKVNEDDLIEVKGGDIVCDYCVEDYELCKHCDTLFNEDYASELEDVCKDCFEELYFQCPICDTNFIIDESEHFDEEFNHLCDKCYEELKHL